MPQYLPQALARRGPVRQSELNGSPAGVRRDLGLLDSIGVGLGAIVGAGIFVVLGVAAGVSGPAVILAIALAGVVAAANALSSAQLAAAYPVSGGTYAYGYEVLNPWAGFVAGWMFLVSKTAAAGTVGLGLGAYLEALIPGVPPRLVGFLAAVLFTLLNYVGIRRTSRLNLAIVAVSLGSLILFLVMSAPAVAETRYEPFAPFGLAGTLEGAALIFFAYTGYARIATLGEEVANPERTIPRAIIWTIAIAVGLYLLVAVVAVGAAGAGGLAGRGDPLRAAAEASAAPWLPTLVSVGALAAMLGVMLSQILGLSRMVYAMARNGDLPAVAAAVHPRFAVPHRAVLIIGATIAVVTLTGSLVGVASAAAFAILIYYGIANVAALRMPVGRKIFSDAVPAVGLVGCVVLAASLDTSVLMTGTVILALGVGARWLLRPDERRG